MHTLLLFLALAGAPSITEVRLPNGLLVVHERRAGCGVVASALWVRAGTGDETAGEHGAAHFLEHLVFKGTASRLPGQIDDAVERLGGILSATTRRDSVRFHTATPAAGFADALMVLADAALRPSLPAGELDRERAIILDEVARADDDAVKRGVDALYAAAFIGRPYARRVLGDPVGLGAIGRTAVKAFHDRLYRPDRSLLAVVGDVSADDARSAAERAFGGWSVPPAKPGALPAPSAGTGEGAKGTEVALAGSGAWEGACVVGARVTLAGASDLALAQTAAAMVGDSQVGRLRSVLLDRGVSVASGYGVAALVDGGLLWCSVMGDRRQLPAFRSEALAAFERLRDGKAEAEEVQMAARRVLGATMAGAETCAGRASQIGQAWCAGDTSWGEAVRAELTRVTPALLAAFAKRALPVAALCTVIVGEAKP